MRRFLFTGSRSWPVSGPRLELVVRAILRMSPGDTLVHGAAEGLDTLVAQIWQPFGPVEGYPAADFSDPKSRNLYMISLGANECHAFATSWRSGTGHCARHARKAGILTFDHGVSTLLENRCR